MFPKRPSSPLGNGESGPFCVYGVEFEMKAIFVIYAALICAAIAGCGNFDTTKVDVLDAKVAALKSCQCTEKSCCSFCAKKGCVCEKPCKCLCCGPIIEKCDCDCSEGFCKCSASATKLPVKCCCKCGTDGTCKCLDCDCRCDCGKCVCCTKCSLKPACECEKGECCTCCKCKSEKP